MRPLQSEFDRWPRDGLSRFVLSIRCGLSRDFDASVSIGRHGGHLAFGCPKNCAVHCCIAAYDDLG